MAIKTVPTATKKYIQSNRTNMYPLANLWSTFNIDLQSNLGALRLSPRMKVNTATASDADLGCPVAFKYYGGKIWAICDTHIFTNSGKPSDAFSDDATTGFQTDYLADESDLETFNGTLCATTTDALYSTDGSNWTNRDTLSGGAPHTLCYFKKYNRLYYSNLESNIISIDSGWVTSDVGTDYAISLSSDSDSYVITSMKSSSNYIWIGVINTNHKGARGKILQWDGQSPTIQNEYPLGHSQGCLSIAIDPKSDSPVAMGSDGILYGYNGSGFAELSRLPFGDIIPYNIDDTDNERFIHPNGMVFTKEGTLYALINNRANTGSVIENMPSGVWEWSKDSGFTHRYSFSYNPVGSTTITDFGQNRISRVGALGLFPISTNTNIDGKLLAGAQYYTDASTATNAIFTENSLDTIKKAGYFVSTFFESDQIEDNWLKLWETHRRLLDSADTIVFKYRLEEEASTEIAITWVDTTHFTTATDISAYAPTASVFDGTYGGEVEVLRGTGGGTCRHITAISDISGGLYTVTIDSAVTGVTTGTATARLQKWVKLREAVTGQVLGYSSMPITKNSPRIQVKTYMEWTGQNEFHKLAIYSTDFLDIQE